MAQPGDQHGIAAHRATQTHPATPNPQQPTLEPTYAGDTFSLTPLGFRFLAQLAVEEGRGDAVAQERHRTTCPDCGAMDQPLAS